MAWRMKPMHVLYCDFADNSKSKYGSAFLVAEILLHYSRPFQKLPASVMLKHLSYEGNLHLLSTIQWCCDFKNIMVWCIRARSIIFQHWEVMQCFKLTITNITIMVCSFPSVYFEDNAEENSVTIFTHPFLTLQRRKQKHTLRLSTTLFIWQHHVKDITQRLHCRHVHIFRPGLAELQSRKVTVAHTARNLWARTRQAGQKDA